MNFRNTAVLGVVLAALAGYFYAFEMDNTPDDAVERVFDIDQSSITRIEVASGDEKTVAEQVPQQGWQITAPIRFPADPATVRDLLNEMATLTPTRTVVDSAADLSTYGLEPPAATVRVSAGLSTPRTLLLGDATATQTAYFAATEGSRKVFLITTASNANLRKTTTDLRDKRVVHVDQDDVDAFTIRFDRNTVTCERDSAGVWRIEEPYRLPAEKNIAVNVVSSIAGFKAVAFVEDNPASLRPYGLDRPYATARLKSRDGSKEVTLSIGKTENNLVYVASSERNTVYGALPNRVQQILKTPEEFRRTTAFDFKSYKVAKADWQIGSEEISAVKYAFEDWRMLKPIETRADDRIINAFLDSLEIVKIHEYIPASPANLKRYGLDPVPASIRLTLEERPFSQTIQIGATSDDGRMIYVRDPEEEWIYAVRSSALQKLPMTAMDVRDRKIVRFKGFEVNVFEIVRGKERWRVRRDEKQRVVWHLEEPTRQQADAVAVGRAFSVLDTLYAEMFVSNEPDADLSRFGLDDPQMRINLVMGGRNNAPEERLSLLVGKAFPGDRSLVYVKRRNSPEVALVKNRFVQELNKMIQNTPTS